MKRLIRGLVIGSVIGVAVGTVMLMRRKTGFLKNTDIRPDKMNTRARGTVRMVKDNAMRWTSAVKNGTEAFSRRLAHRTS